MAIGGVSSSTIAASFLNAQVRGQTRPSAAATPQTVGRDADGDTDGSKTASEKSTGGLVDVSG